MIYVMSDLHGCYDKYIKMLELIRFSDDDVLYVLGDVIDRGNKGISILLDMAKQKNVIPLLGNHEHTAIPVIKAITAFPAALDRLYPTKAHRFWFANGGEVTENEFCALSPEEKQRVCDYLGEFSVYTEIEVCGKKYHLSHSIPEYDENRDIHDVDLFSFVWGEPDYNVRYSPDVTYVTGHTPTGLIDPEYIGKIYKNAGHIAIDCGAVFENGRLGCLCLDTMEEFYV